MTAAQYRDALERLGLSQNDVATLLGFSLRTSQAYALGETEIPRAVSLLLQMLLKNRMTVEELEKLR